MNDSVPPVPPNSGKWRRWWPAGLAALMIICGVTLWQLSRDNRASVTMRIDATRVTANDQLQIHFSVELNGRVVQYSLEERRPNGHVRVGGGRELTLFDWFYYTLIVNKLSETGHGAGMMTLGSYPREMVPPVGREFKVRSGEAKTILTMGAGETKTELTLRCE